MSIAFAILIVLAVYVLTRLAQDYLRRAMGSLSRAEAVWSELIREAELMIEENIPATVAQAVVGLLSAAGCGCFVRGVIVSHYLPRVRTSPPNPTVERAFADLEQLSAAQRERFSHLVMLVIVYDSFRNPFQGWVFRRIIAAYDPNRPPSFTDKIEAAVAAFTVLSRKASRA